MSVRVLIADDQQLVRTGFRKILEAEPDLEVRGAWWAFGIPVLLSGWIVATNGWLEATRDELARALGESDRRFRAYWADPGR